MTRNRLIWTLALAGTLSMAIPAGAQQAGADYPTRPVRLLVGYAPGASTDIVARTIAAKLTERWGVQVIVENRPGANTITAVHYRGGTPAIIDTLSGQIPMMIGTIASQEPHVKVGKLKPLIVTSAQRSPALPDVPTVAEQGFPGLVSDYWLGIMGPAGLPARIVEKINRDVNAALGLQDVRANFARRGIAPAGGSAPEMQKYFNDELAMWATVVRDAGLERLQM